MYLEGWKLGLKAIAIYRDNCKVAQPLSADKKKTPAPAEVDLPGKPVRRRLPSSRPARTVSFSVGEAEGYITAGEYPDDGIGEIFLKVSKQGSTLSGVMDAFAIAVSLGLQYGVPLEAFLSKFVNMRFEPSGITKDPDIRFGSSLVDYVFRKLALEYLPADKRAVQEDVEDDIMGKSLLERAGLERPKHKERERSAKGKSFDSAAAEFLLDDE